MLHLARFSVCNVFTAHQKTKLHYVHFISSVIIKTSSVSVTFIHPVVVAAALCVGHLMSPKGDSLQQKQLSCNTRQTTDERNAVVKVLSHLFKGILNV